MQGNSDFKRTSLGRQEELAHDSQTEGGGKCVMFIFFEDFSNVHETQYKHEILVPAGFRWAVVCGGAPDCDRPFSEARQAFPLNFFFKCFYFVIGMR